jgi:hypothetical protein
VAEGGKFAPGKPPGAPSAASKPIPAKFLPPAAPTHPPSWDILFRADPEDGEC